MSAYRKLVLIALMLALGVVVLGAYVRLSDAGLRCQDWPECYGKQSPQEGVSVVSPVQIDKPSGGVSHARAWKEMVHSYFAGALDLLVLAILWLSVKQKTHLNGSLVLPVIMVGVVVFQVILGVWTVTEEFKPLDMTGHLLGDMTILASLSWLWQRESQLSLGGMANVRSLRPWGVAALLVLFIQVVLGGWVSSNDAALACSDFPTCHGAWVPDMQFEAAFSLHRKLEMDGQGKLLSLQALTAIQWVHRVWGVAVLLMVGFTAIKLIRQRGLCMLGLILLVMLLVQVGLGIGSVRQELPLAVAHTAGAALLLSTLVVINYRLFRMR